MEYKDPYSNPNNSLDDESSHKPISEGPLPPLPNILLNTVDQINKIVNDEIITIQDDETRKYLVR